NPEVEVSPEAVEIPSELPTSELPTSEQQVLKPTSEPTTSEHQPTPEQIPSKHQPTSSEPHTEIIPNQNS
ncbi:hypothetical protein A2U01_0110939, partial [Trifolium medium]|nr:hypothetical protein [Trifolium medium]